LATRKEITISKTKQISEKIPLKQTAITMQNDKSLNVVDAFDLLNGSTRTNLSTILALTDFSILYSSLVIVVSDNDKNTEAALYFLKQFFQYKIPERPSEIGILFAVLIVVHHFPSAILGHPKILLSMVITIDQNSMNKLLAGADCKKKELSDFCKETLQYLHSSDQKLVGDDFVHLINDASDENTVIRTLNSNLQIVKSGKIPDSVSDFISNNLKTMLSFSHSASILLLSSQVISVCLKFNSQIQIPLVSDLLDFCFSFLSGETFLSGEKGFQATESIQHLIDNAFDLIVPQILLPSIAAVATTQLSPLALLTEKLREYVFSHEVDPNLLGEISQQFDYYHPGQHPSFLPVLNSRFPFLNIPESAQRLLDAETIFEELDAIIQTKNFNLIDQHPSYLRNFLQNSFLIFDVCDISG
jgi:hypothetical protein